MIDGAEALTSAIRKMLGSLAEIQRCQIHKRRNILGYLPDRLHESVKAVLKEAWSLCDAKVAKRRLERLASSPSKPIMPERLHRSLKDSTKRSPFKGSGSAGHSTRSFVRPMPSRT